MKQTNLARGALSAARRAASFLIGCLFLSACAVPRQTAPSFDLEDSVKPFGPDAAITVERIEGLEDLRSVKLRGSPSDYGRLWGEIARGAGLSPKPAGSDSSINEAIMAFYAEIDPNYLEFIGGIAEAFGLGIRDVDLRFMERDFFMDYRILDIAAKRSPAMLVAPQGRNKAANPRWACTIVSADGDGSSFVGRNADMAKEMFSWRRFLVRSELSDEYRFIGNALLSPVNLVIDGINEKGLFVGNMAVCYPYEYQDNGLKPYPDRPVVDPNHAMRILLARCTDVDEAIALAERMPQWFSAGGYHHLLVADDSGASAVLEWDLEDNLHVLRGEGDYQVCANSALHLGEDTASFDQKYVVARASIKAAGGGEAGLRETMVKVRVPSELAREAKTAWTSVFDIAGRSMEVRHDLDAYQRATAAFITP